MYVYISLCVLRKYCPFEFEQVLVAAVSIGCLFPLSKFYGFIGIWIALCIYMSLRTFAGIWR